MLQGEDLLEICLLNSLVLVAVAGTIFATRLQDLTELFAVVTREKISTSTAVQTLIAKRTLMDHIVDRVVNVQNRSQQVETAL